MSQKPPPVPRIAREPAGSGPGTARGRKRLSARRIVLISLLLVPAAVVVFAGIWLLVWNQLQNRDGATLVEARQGVDRLVDERYDSYRQTGTTTGTDSLERMAQEYDRAGPGRGTAAKMARLSADLMRLLKEGADPLQASIDRVRDAGRTNPETFTNPEALDDRIQLFQEMESETERYLIFYEDLPLRVEETARKRGFSRYEIQHLMVQVQRELQIKKHREYRTATIRFCREAGHYLKFLHENWGRWRYDPDSKAIVVEDPVGELRLRHEQLANALEESDEALTEAEANWMEGTMELIETLRAERKKK